MFRLFTRDEIKPRNLKNTFYWDGREYSYAITNDNLHIKDSYTISKEDFTKIFNLLTKEHPSSDVWKRSFTSLKREWACHNFLWSYGIARTRVKDVDLNYPLKWYVNAAYYIGGLVVWPFIN